MLHTSRAIPALTRLSQRLVLGADELDRLLRRFRYASDKVRVVRDCGTVDASNHAYRWDRKIYADMNRIAVLMDEGFTAVLHQPDEQAGPPLRLETGVEPAREDASLP